MLFIWSIWKLILMLIIVLNVSSSWAKKNILIKGDDCLCYENTISNQTIFGLKSRDHFQSKHVPIFQSGSTRTQQLDEISALHMEAGLHCIVHTASLLISGHSSTTDTSEYRTMTLNLRWCPGIWELTWATWACLHLLISLDMLLITNIIKRSLRHIKQVINLKFHVLKKTW